MKTAPVGVSHGSVSLLFAWLTTLLLVIMRWGHIVRAASRNPAPGIRASIVSRRLFRAIAIGWE